MDIVEHLRTAHGIPMVDDAPRDASGAFHLGLHNLWSPSDHEHDPEELTFDSPVLQEMHRQIAAVYEASRTEVPTAFGLGAPETAEIRKIRPPELRDRIVRNIKETGDPVLIPFGFWSNEGGPWYWSARAGLHDAATHELCAPQDADNPTDIDALCHRIEDT